VIVIALVLILSPQQAALRTLADQDMRVATVGAALARAGGGDLCPGQHLSTSGLMIQDGAQYSAATRADAAVALGLGDGPTVVGIVPGTAIEMLPGDVVTAVAGVAVVDGPRGGPYARIGQVEDAIERATGSAIALDIRRNGRPMRVELALVPGCRSRFQIAHGGLQATKADGRYVQISDRMIDLAPDDGALAAILAHELAHNILRHAALKTSSKQAEYEADRLSVWLVARAGYDLDAVLPFWERLRKRSDYGIFADGSHPGWKNRLAAIAAAVATVRAQRAAAQDLVPPPQQSTSQARNRR
jgi:beta-barrel assembly-enhancing protease